MAGRRPKPTAIKELEGNPGKRKLVDDDIQPERIAPEMPKFLSTKVARREWKFMCKALLDLGVLTNVDRQALGDYCEAVSQKELALTNLKEKGAVLDTFAMNDDGVRIYLRSEKNPWFSVWLECCKLEKAFLIEFGLTPASRSKIKVERKPKEDEFDSIMRRPGTVAPFVLPPQEPSLP